MSIPLFSVESTLLSTECQTKSRFGRDHCSDVGKHICHERRDLFISTRKRQPSASMNSLLAIISISIFLSFLNLRHDLPHDHSSVKWNANCANRLRMQVMDHNRHDCWSTHIVCTHDVPSNSKLIPLHIVSTMGLNLGSQSSNPHNTTALFFHSGFGQDTLLLSCSSNGFSDDFGQVSKMSLLCFKSHDTSTYLFYPSQQF